MNGFGRVVVSLVEIKKNKVSQIMICFEEIQQLQGFRKGREGGKFPTVINQETPPPSSRS
jgi:hypothetical protein